MAKQKEAGAIGKHALTSELVACFTRQAKTFAIADSDVARFLHAGRKRDPDGLLEWLRDLTVLIATLQGPMASTATAEQLRIGLFAPLCELIEGHATQYFAREKRQASAKRVTADQLKSLERPNRTAGLSRTSKPIGATLRPRGK